MSQLEELESRIAAAFQRIAAGVETLAARGEGGGGGSATVAEDGLADQLLEAQAALEVERREVTRLTAQLVAASAEKAEAVAGLRDEVDRLNRALDAQGLDVQRLTSTVAQLREELRRLREGAEQGLRDPAMINRAMLAELEALRAARAAEANEMAEILAALGPILEEEEARAHA